MQFSTPCWFILKRSNIPVLVGRLDSTTRQIQGLLTAAGRIMRSGMWASSLNQYATRGLASLRGCQLALSERQNYED
jgi:hypothetical protein